MTSIYNKFVIAKQITNGVFCRVRNSSFLFSLQACPDLTLFDSFVCKRCFQSCVASLLISDYFIYRDSPKERHRKLINKLTFKSLKLIYDSCWQRTRRNLRQCPYSFYLFQLTYRPTHFKPLQFNLTERYLKGF